MPARIRHRQLPRHCLSWCFAVAVLCAGCGSHLTAPPTGAASVALTGGQVAALNSERIFFGHQSVGYNILQGICDIERGDSRLTLPIRTSTEPQQIAGPALVETPIGKNGDRKSKLNQFAQIIKNGLGAQGGVALMKFCYLDIGPSTDVPRMFADYRAEMDNLTQEYPRLRLVYVTIPLTTVEPAPKAWFESLAGRTTRRDLDAKRNEFNRLLRQTYGGTGSVFDLARAESTRADGSRSFFERDGERVYTLAPEYTTDGGHLNEAGRRAAAMSLLEVLSGPCGGSGSHPCS